MTYAYFLRSLNESKVLFEDHSINIDSDFLTNFIFYYTLLAFILGFIVGCMVMMVLCLVFHKTFNRVSNIFTPNREIVAERLFNIPPESDVEY